MPLIYPDEVTRLFASPSHAGRAAQANAVGAAANFDCGSFVRISMRIDPSDKIIGEARFHSNGCGFMIAAAEFTCRTLEGKSLTDLHGDLANEVLLRAADQLAHIPAERASCIGACAESISLCFADFRAFVLEEFAGEKALICTCFGVSEETIERKIEELNLSTVEEVGAACNAGRGCGSCQFLIREILDSLQTRHDRI